MAERRTKVQIVPGGPTVDAFDVDIEESSEKWSEYKLSDGSTIRVRQAVFQISRAVSQYDQEGNPLYIVKAQPIMTVIEVPEALKRKVN